MFNTFILSFSPFSTDPTPRRILEYAKSHAHTYQYLTPFAGTIVIKSSANLAQLIDSYTAFLSPNNFLLTHINPLYVTGLMQTPYWEWLNSSNPPALTSTQN